MVSGFGLCWTLVSRILHLFWDLHKSHSGSIIAKTSKWRTPQVCNSTCFIFLIPQQSSTIFNPFPISTLDSWCRLMQIEGFWQFETDEQRLVQLVFSLTHLVHDFAPPLLCTLARAYVSWWSTGHHGCLSCHLNSLNLFQCGETQSIYDTMHAYIYIYYNII